jgi:serine protease Do
VGRAWSALASGLGIAALAACAPTMPVREATSTPPVASTPRCTIIQGDQSLAECERRAVQTGDADAAFSVAQYYERSPTRRSAPLALTWYERAAAARHPGALRRLFDIYHYGTLAPRNSARAEDYLRQAADVGSEWALLITAKREEKSEPTAAFVTYLRVAVVGNCYAQARVARAYTDGDLTAVALPRSYFWSLLAGVDTYSRRFDGHGVLRDSAVAWSDDSCALLPIRIPHVENQLPPEIVRAVQQAAGAWRQGQPEPTLPAYARTDPPGPGTPLPPRVAERPRAAARVEPGERWPNWQPAAEAVPVPLTGPRAPSDLFVLASRSVWLVVAARSADDPASTTIGSAVAITASRLVTNCHVVRNLPSIFVRQGETFLQATVAAGDRESDRCLLEVAGAPLVPVGGIRRYADLRVGEPVFTIGAPRGLEQSLGQGIVSGLRRRTAVRLIQTTAQVSPGSSGGGLFDQAGNLLGVTTFIVKDSDGLNFAIAIEDYFER